MRRDLTRRQLLTRTAAGAGAAAVASVGLGCSDDDSAAGDSAGRFPAAADIPPLDHEAFLDASGDEVLLAGQPVSWWIDRFDLPLHVSNRADIRRNVRAFVEVFERMYPNGHVRYAAKANAHPAVFRAVFDEGGGVDVASPFELQAALDAGIDPDLIDLNGNAKDDALIERAVEEDILIVLDNVAEMAVVSAAADRLGKTARVVIRLSGFELGSVTASAVFTAGVWNKFGIPLDDLPAFLSTLGDHPNVDTIGFHTHIGTQVTEVEPFLAILSTMLELREPLEAAGGRLEIVNLGGGMPIAYVDRPTWDDVVDRVRRGYEASVDGDLSQVFYWDNGLGGFEPGDDGAPDLSEWKGEKFTSDFPKEMMLEAVFDGEVTVHGATIPTLEALEAAGNPTVVIEPGRSVAGDTGITLARVGFVRPVAGEHQLTSLELGVTSYGEGMVSHPVRAWSVVNDHKRRDPEPFETFIAGNLCFSGDMMARIKIPFGRRLVRGDIVLVPATGAYNPTFFASNANSFPRPARVMVNEDGTLTMLKERDSYEQVFSLPDESSG